MITKKEKVNVILKFNEYVDMKKVANMLNNYLTECDETELQDLNQQIFAYCGVEDGVGDATNVLEYLYKNATIVDN